MLLALHTALKLGTQTRSSLASAVDLLPGARPTTTLDALDAHYFGCASSNQDRLGNGAVLPATFEQVAGQQQHRLGTVIGHHEFADHRRTLAFGNNQRP